MDGKVVTGQLISLGGTKMEDGRTWGHSQDLMSRTFKITDTSIDLDKLTSLKSFQITASHKNRTSSGSTTPRLMNSAACDLEPPESSQVHAILYGGQSVDNGLTSDEIVLIKGTVDEDISVSKIEVTRYPSFHHHYSEFGIPAGWPDGSNLVQVGDVPEGRTGSALTLVRKVGSSFLLASIGGHSKPDFGSDFKHPENSICLLLVPEMRWWKLSNSESLKRSFHSQTSHSDGDILVLGGMSMKNQQWAIIHPLTQLIKISINNDFEYSEVVINLTTEIEDLPFITNFSSCVLGDNIFIFSGFIFPEYNHQEENLYKFQPPIAKRNKLPKFSKTLFKIALQDQKVSISAVLDEGGAYNGSAVGISGKDDPSEVIIHADPKILLYSERILDAPKCDLQEEFGFCSLSIAEKKRDAYYCATPICELKIHVKCDKSIKGKPGPHQFCPKCRHLDPATWKPAPGASRPRWRKK